MVPSIFKPVIKSEWDLPAIVAWSCQTFEMHFNIFSRVVFENTFMYSTCGLPFLVNLSPSCHIFNIKVASHDWNPYHISYSIIFECKTSRACYICQYARGYTTMLKDSNQHLHSKMRPASNCSMVLQNFYIHFHNSSEVVFANAFMF